jgi:GNAT superfamily N-acetyltransferase
VTASIRTATAADVSAIVRFQTDSWREAYRTLVPLDYLDRVSAADREIRWRERLVSGARQVALAELDETLVGVVSWSDGTEAGVAPLELKSLYVATAQHGTGLASRLLNHAIGAAPAYLWVFAANSRARAFYAKHGFRPDGTHQIDTDTGVPELRYARP